MRPAELHLLGDVAEQCDFERTRHRIRNLGLQCQHITESAVIGLRPKVKPGNPVHQLRGDANGVS